MSLFSKVVLCLAFALLIVKSEASGVLPVDKFPEFDKLMTGMDY